MSFRGEGMASELALYSSTSLFMSSTMVAPADMEKINRAIRMVISFFIVVISQ
jgi:hypothetical protein